MRGVGGEMVVGEGADDGRANGSDGETDGRCETNQRRRKRPDKQPRWRRQTGRAVKVRDARERERARARARERERERARAHHRNPCGERDLQRSQLARLE
jgi:hypothetical protein